MSRGALSLSDEGGWFGVPQAETKRFLRIGDRWSCVIIAWSLVADLGATFNPCHDFRFAHVKRSFISVSLLSSKPVGNRQPFTELELRGRPILFSLPLVDFWFSLILSRLSSVIREKLSASLFHNSRAFCFLYHCLKSMWSFYF